MGDVLEGDERAPSASNQARTILQGLKQYLPDIAKAVSGGEHTYEKGILNSEKKLTPERARLQHFLYKTYAPKMANVQNRLQDIQSSGDLNRMQNQGSSAYRQAGALAREQDPEYYGTRSLVAGNLANMMNSPLSGNESEAITRGVQRMRVNSGTGDIMGNANTAAHAMLYGQAARNRQLQNMQLAQGILPTLQTTDVGQSYQLASGRPLADSNKEISNTSLTGAGNQFGQGFLNNSFGGQNAGMQINANRRTVMDYVGQAWQQSGLGQATANMGCWIAREVFGEDSPKWLMFREWLLTKAPKWFHKWYMKNGPSVAKWLRNKPKLKLLISIWMEGRIYAR